METTATIVCQCDMTTVSESLARVEGLFVAQIGASGLIYGVLLVQVALLALLLILSIFQVPRK